MVFSQSPNCATLIAGLSAAVSDRRGADHRRHGALAVCRNRPVSLLLACRGSCALLHQLFAPGGTQGEATQSASNLAAKRMVSLGYPDWYRLACNKLPKRLSVEYGATSDEFAHKPKLAVKDERLAMSS